MPPRRLFLPFPDFHKIVSNNHPSYIIGDVNAKHTILGDQSNNIVGRGLEFFMNIGKIRHLRPQFPTYRERQTTTTPDIVLLNK